MIKRWSNAGQTVIVVQTMVRRWSNRRAGTVAEEGARVFRHDVARLVGLLREALPALDDALLRAKARGAITRCCTHGVGGCSRWRPTATMDRSTAADAERYAHRPAALILFPQDFTYASRKMESKYLANGEVANVYSSASYMPCEQLACSSELNQLRALALKFHLRRKPGRNKMYARSPTKITQHMRGRQC